MHTDTKTEKQIRKDRHTDIKNKENTTNKKERKKETNKLTKIEEVARFFVQLNKISKESKLFHQKFNIIVQKNI